MNGQGSNFSSRSCRPDADCSAPEAKGDGQAGDCSPPPTSAVDGTMPAVLSGVQPSILHADQDNQICDLEGCEHMAESSQMSEGGRIDRVCAEHKKPAVKAAAIARAAHCEHPGCSKTPRYGPQEGPLSFCQAHKRAGQYTVRDGQLFVATRDGRAFRGSRDTAASQASAPTATVAPPEDAKALSSVPGSGNSKLSFSPKEDTCEKGPPCLVPGRRGKSRFHTAEVKAELGSKENAGKAADQGKGPPCKVLITDRATQTEERKIKDGKAASLPSPSFSSAPSAPQRPASVQEKHRTTAPLPPSGLTPSDEIRLFQEARESARVAAQASGSGRRPRAPSRKLLEASGKMTGDSIQWMTKEKKEEEARLKLEMKEKRKAAAAAGLKFGHVMEAFTIPTPVDATTATGDGEIAGAGTWSGINAAESKVLRRELTPEATLQAAGKDRKSKGAQVDARASKATLAEATDEETLGKQDNGALDPAATVAKLDSVSERKRKGLAGEPIVEMGGTKMTKRCRQTRGKA